MAERQSSESEPFVDVARLVDDLRDRVERERAAGGYAEDVAAFSLEPVLTTPQPETAEESEIPETDNTPQVVYRPQVGYSSRPIIGPVLTAVKRVFYRLFFYPLDDLARQTNDAVQRLQQRLDASTGRAEAAVAVETAARETSVQAARERIDTLVSQLELGHQLLALHVAELEAAHERLQLQSRLGRLERLVRSAPQPKEASAAPVTRDHQPAPFDYMTFENRFRPERTVRERHSDYVEVLSTQKRVVDLGCGRGELLELLSAADVSAYGVDLDPDNVAICQEKGLEIVEGDAVSHLEGLEESEVDGVVASHLIEHLNPENLWRLITASAEKLAGDGILILETPNPESLIAGSINFHRDPTHLRPVHPDTLSFLCESAGFRSLEIRRLAPVPTEVRLPQRLPDENPLAQHVNEVVEQLNELIYGYQDYALIARL
jgi:2-polyprenyl-3-methyl-5-hydroxy-6-metoxy-1,4-benzoquinol methylase